MLLGRQTIQLLRPLSSAGHLDKAKQSALVAKTAYRAVEKFFPRLGAIQSQKRELIAVKLGKLISLIEKLSGIK